MGRTQSYNVALFAVELTAAKAPGDYLIVNEQTGQRSILSLGLSLDGHVKSIRFCGVDQELTRASAKSRHLVSAELGNG
jgi:hypothetical protein